MRRRRRHLEVSTFPFLAVLLCTMGALILLLLVLDRRAKIVAMLKVKNEFAQVQAEQDRREQQRLRQQADEDHLSEERQVEWERRRRQLHDMLAHEEQDLLGQIKGAKEKLADAEAKARAKESLTEQEQRQ